MSKPHLTALALMFALGVGAHAAHAEGDWRKTASQEDKIANLIRVTPNAGMIMIEVGERYKNLYWAGQLGKWDFAKYQLEELEENLRVLAVSRPGRAATAEDFLANGLDLVETAIEKQDKKAFARGFEHMREQCMVCHVRNEVEFIELPAKPRTASSPVLNLK